MSRNLVKAAGLLLIINVGVKLLGFAREMAIANEFGASFLTDAYVAAYTFPYFFQAVLGFAFISAVLPILSQHWQEDGNNEYAYRIGSSLINITALGMSLISIVGIIIAPTLIWLTAPGLNPATADLAVDLARILFPSTAFMSVGVVIAGILNSRFRFAAVAIAPGICSLVIILSIALFAKGNVYVLAWGTLLGFIVFFLVQLIDLPKTGLKYRIACDLKDPAIRRVLSNLLPIIIGFAVNQIYLIISRIFASSLAEGSISALNFASKVMYLPFGLFVAAIITAAFPALAQKAQLADKSELTSSVKKGLTMVLLVALPSAIGMMILDEEIIRLLFQRGSFTADNTAMTASALMPMAPGLVFLAMSMLIMRVYYSLHDVKTPLITGLISIAVNVVFCIILIGPMGIGGLSLAGTIAAFVNAILLLLFLNRRIPLFNDNYIAKNALIAAIGSFAIAIPVVLGKLFWPVGETQLALAVWLLSLIAAACLVYFIVLKLMRSAALTEIFKGLRKK